MRVFLIALTAFFYCGIAHAQSAEHLAAVERASAVGWELYQHDQAAWHGTDAMRAEIANPANEGFSGWFTERGDNGIALLFVRGEGEILSVAYRSLYRNGEIRETGRIERPLTEAERRIFRARQIANAAFPPETCARTYNSVILPRAERGPDGVDIDVYLMPAFEDMRQVPFGGHYRLVIDSEASIVRETAQFTHGCVTIDTAANGADRPAALMITQLIGETPTEVHVFLSLTVRTPIYVSARSGLWAVQGRNIRFMRELPES